MVDSLAITQMAEKYTFFKIGEANAEIKRLSGEVERLTAELGKSVERADAAEKNAEEVGAQAKEAIQNAGEAVNLRKELDSEKKAHQETQGKLAIAEKEVAALPEKIKSEGSKEAQRIMASFGHAPVKQPASENPANPKPASGATGFNRVMEAFKAQSASTIETLPK